MSKAPMENAEIVYVSLGSNLEDPLQQVQTALEELQDIPDTELAAGSSWYQSQAVGPGEQPDYINGVAQLRTSLIPQRLLENLQTIEKHHGRVRKERWGARTLDLDILLFGDQIILSDNLQVPHPRLRERNFVIYPLVELNPDLVLPDHTPISTVANSLNWQGLKRLP